MTQVEVSYQDEVLFVGELAPAPWTFWHGVIFDGSVGERDQLLEKLQASNARWEGYLNAEGNYVLHLPPIFKVTKIETLI